MRALRGRSQRLVAVTQAERRRRRPLPLREAHWRRRRGRATQEQGAGALHQAVLGGGHARQGPHQRAARRMRRLPGCLRLLVGWRRAGCRRASALSARHGAGGGGACVVLRGGSCAAHCIGPVMRRRAPKRKLAGRVARLMAGAAGALLFGRSWRGSCCAGLVTWQSALRCKPYGMRARCNAEATRIRQLVGRCQLGAGCMRSAARCDGRGSACACLGSVTGRGQLLCRVYAQSVALHRLHYWCTACPGDGRRAGQGQRGELNRSPMPLRGPRETGPGEAAGQCGARRRGGAGPVQATL